MSRLTQYAYEQLGKSEFIFRNENTLEIRNAVIIFANFAGKANRFGNTTKNFNVVINDEVMQHLLADPNKKWNIHELGGETEEDPVIHFINVKIRMDSQYPANVTLYTDFRGMKNHTSLTDETIGCLDRITMDSADCILNLYESRMHEGHFTAYLKKLNVIQIKEADFGGKYDDWEDPIEPNPELVNQNADVASED